MRNPDRQPTFRFKQFEISNCRSAMKVGTDGVLLGAWAFGGIPPEREVRVLDVGCGTGVIVPNAGSKGFNRLLSQALKSIVMQRGKLL